MKRFLVLGCILIAFGIAGNFDHEDYKQNQQEPTREPIYCEGDGISIMVWPQSTGSQTYTYEEEICERAISRVVNSYP